MTREGDTVTVTCASTHLTSFAVLVDVGGAKVLHINHYSLLRTLLVLRHVTIIYI